MSMDLISVVVPIYNTEAYLEACVDSIRKQSYKKIEIILVDDGSKDSSGKICDRLKEADDRIKVLHKENGGLSDARNAGLRVASGEFICFIDSDDIIHADMLSSLEKMLNETGADIAECGMECFEDGAYPDTALPGDEISVVNLSNIRAMERLFISTGFIEVSACNKLYRSVVFSDNLEPYPKGKYHEDVYTTYRLLYSSSGLVYTDRPLYFYRQRTGGITGCFSDRKLDALGAGKESLEFVARNCPQLTMAAEAQYAYIGLGIVHSIHRLKNDDKHYIGLLNEYLFSQKIKYSRNKYFGARLRLLLWLYEHVGYWTYKLYMDITM